MELTDEIRRAVWVEQCQRLGGHDVDVADAFPWSAATGQAVQNLAAAEEQIPNIRCRRCGRTWLVVPIEGVDYDDAERALYALLQGDTPLAKRIVRHRSRRERKRLERERGEGDPGPPAE